MNCTIETEIGRGSNAVVYKGTYPDLLNRSEKHIVLIKELFPFHARADIRRGEDGTVLCGEDGRETFETHRLSFENGNRIHLKMLERYPDRTGENVNTFEANGTFYTVLGYTGGRSLDHEIDGGKMQLKQLAGRMLGLLDALEAFHESGFLHLDIAPDNILLIGKDAGERVMLIDYNSVYDMNGGEADAEVYYSVKQGYTAPEVRTGKAYSIGPASDLYSVCAVFYCCLTGAPLTPFQMIRPNPPDVSDCALLRGMPDTVCSMVQQILRRGLQTLPQKRYGSTAEMREAIQELIDRINGVGITHWALWEAGRKTVARVIRDNPSYAYLKDTEHLFPANAVSGSGETRSMKEWIGAMLSEGGQNALLTAPGGMGKTTSMFRAMTEQAARYSPVQPAIAYISLYGWKEGSTTYIRDKILENLHYKSDTHSYDDARHALQHLLGKPLASRNGDRPVLMLFLDGLNEASGSTQALMDEIAELSKLDGIRMLISTRSEEETLPFLRLRLIPLEIREACEILSDHGLLMPGNEAVRELLRTPLMLSIFLQSAQAEEKQLTVQTEEELLRAYFSSLLEKERKNLPDDTDAKWQTEAALYYVLPTIAGELHRRQTALNDTELLKTVGQCYRLFSSPLLRRAFPEWIGHSRAIRGNAANAEEWYGIVVHDLLWKRLGLLVRNSSGTYQIVHQVIGEYLTEQNRQNQRKIGHRRQIGIGLIAAAAVLFAIGGTVFYHEVLAPPQHNEMLADRLVNYGLSAYQSAGTQYRHLRELADCALNTPERYADQLSTYQKSTRIPFTSQDQAILTMEKMLEEGEVMPWSGDPLETEQFSELMEMAAQYAEESDRMVAALTYVMEEESAARRFSEYPAQFSELIDMDAEIFALLYQVSCRTHLLARYDDETSAEAKTYRSVTQTYAELNQYFMDDSVSTREIIRHIYEDLYQPRNSLRTEISSSGIFGMLQWKEGQP